VSEVNNRSSKNFLEENIEEDLGTGRYPHVATRFPPEPNGYLHIGHAKAICIDFGLARQYGGTCNLRFDDTNPSKEDTEYVESIMEDVRWLGFEWDGLYYASSYFLKIYKCAQKLIKEGKAFVCDLSAEQIRDFRGTLTQPGRVSPFRGRTIEENLELFENMRAGRYADGSRVLRAKIDMSSPNINLRDPVIYRILRATHHNTGDTWCIYPMYDFAHPISDAIEGITHSMCTLEFEDHRPLYDWILMQLKDDWAYLPRQMEFARLNITRTVMSKRHLKKLVDTGVMNGWDDPRMPTLCGLRRRGYTPTSIRTFCEKVGVSKANSMVDAGFLEHCVREELNETAPRAMVVLKPLKVVIENYPEEKTEHLEIENGTDQFGGKTAFSREIFIECEDFMEIPPPKYHRLFPGSEVRLKGAYIIRCESVIKNTAGEIIELRCTFDPDSKSGMAGAARKVKGTLHWVESNSAVDIDVRLYDQLLRDTTEDEEESPDISTKLNPTSRVVLKGCKAEPYVAEAEEGTRLQFLRQGYFIKDKDSAPGMTVYNRIVGLKDSYAKLQTK
jgi:glutaminyl-tRNA synthetase